MGYTYKANVDGDIDSSSNHREDAEWLTIEICREFRKRAKQIISNNGNNVGPMAELQLELQRRCDITEIEAINIINGFYAADYVHRYERIRNHTAIEVKNPEYLEWLAQKEQEEQYKKLEEL